jgi:hypothetical protein
MNTWQKDGNTWRVRCDREEQPGSTVTVTNRAGQAKQVTLGERLNRLGFVYAVADTRPQAQAVGDLAGVLALFDKAREHLKRPAIVLAVPGLTPSEPIGAITPTGERLYQWDERLRASGCNAVYAPPFTIRLSIAGDKARVPGSITVLDGERTEEGRDWFGRILRDGTYQPSNAANGRTQAITARLRAFAAEPAKVAKDSARLTGRCCFCNLALKDERSTAVGYGATCADHFGLPWGERPAGFAEGV